MTVLEKKQRELAAPRQVRRFPKEAPRRWTGRWVGVLAGVAVLAVGLAVVTVSTGGDEIQTNLGSAGDSAARRDLHNQMYPGAEFQNPDGESLVESLVRHGVIPAETLERPTLEDLYDQTHGVASPLREAGLMEQLVQQGSIPAASLESYRVLAIDPRQDLYNQTHSDTSYPQTESLVERLVQQGSIPAETLEP